MIRELAERKWIGLIAASLGMALGALDLMVNVALPAITAGLGATMQSVQWVIVLYVGTMTGLQLIAGRLADSQGLKRCYLAGIFVYGAAVLAIGLSETLGMVLALRILQAVGFALMAATAPALVSRLFSQAGRGQALGFMATVSTVGAVAGTLGGGQLVESFGWASTFLVRAPLAAVAFLLAALILPEHRGDAAPMDWRGAVLLFAALSGIALFLNLGPREGWLSASALGTLVVGIGAALLFARIERGHPHPILRLDLISGNIALALVSAFLMPFTTFVNLFLLPFLVTDALGFGAGTLGLLLTLPPAASAVAAPTAGWIADRIEPRWVVAGTLAWLAVTMYTFTWLTLDASVFDLGWRLLMFGVGMGAFQTSNLASVMAEMPSNALSTGAAMPALAFGLGMATSVGVMGAVFEAIRSAAIVSSAGPEQAFLSAFTDTYFIAAALLVIGALINWRNPTAKAN